VGVDFAVIGGTGVYDPGILNNKREQGIETPYGMVVVTIGEISGKEVAFLARHGVEHTVPPHLINYRANIWALKHIGVKKVLATAAVGSVARDFSPGQFVMVDQFLDFTKNRPATFFTGEPGVVHIDMTDPYCSQLRAEVVGVGRSLGIKLKNGGNYVCTEGPRFETPAEIRMFQMLGAQLVGMTSVPEVILAKECAMCYAAIAMVTNYAAGIYPKTLTHQEVVENMEQMGEKLRRLIAGVFQELTPERSCPCPHAIDELGKF